MGGDQRRRTASAARIRASRGQREPAGPTLRRATRALHRTCDGRVRALTRAAAGRYFSAAICSIRRTSVGRILGRSIPEKSLDKSKRLGLRQLIEYGAPRRIVRPIGSLEEIGDLHSQDCRDFQQSAAAYPDWCPSRIFAPAGRPRRVHPRAPSVRAPLPNLPRLP
jgi:hypothetical protein